MGTLVQANSSKAYWKKELTWGSQATSNYQTLRFNRFDFGQVTGTTVSEEITPTREPGSVIRNQVTTEGTLECEMTLASPTSNGHLALFESLFGSTWQADLAIGSALLDVTTVVASNTAHWVATSSVFTNVRVGDWVRATGFALPANNGAYYVSAKTSDLDITVKNPNALAETTATAVTVSGSRLVFGNTLIGLSFEQEIGAVEKIYHMYTGNVMRAARFNLTPGQIIKPTFEFIGKVCGQSTTSQSGTQVATDTNTILNAIDNIEAFYETQQGLTETWKVSELNINIESQIDPRLAIQSIGPVGIRLGRGQVTGSMRIYLEHGVNETGGVRDIFASYLAGTARSDAPGGLGVILSDTAASVKLALMFQKIFITNARAPVSGVNEDMFLTVDFTGQVDAATTNGPTNSSSTAFSMHRMQ